MGAVLCKTAKSVKRSTESGNSTFGRNRK